MGGALRGIFGYCFLVFMTRIVGRRPGKQMEPFEFVLIFFMGGITLTPMVGDDRSISNAFITIMSIALTHFLMAWLKQVSPGFGRIVDGTPLVLFEKGKRHIETMKKMRVSDADVMTAARNKGITSLDQIEYAILERNGQIVVLQSEDSQ
ncbi:MAG: DUF421 domain-containing protein [Acidobacteriaceae bacterium]|nr:DUF421 domain-containing protein [Acidobacteriaceae bacterium]MBV8570702.1 DUF421 domain-containing protein [Acidobacteriaceae bacterium]